jgi:hypothetical protein
MWVMVPCVLVMIFSFSAGNKQQAAEEHQNQVCRDQGAHNSDTA